MKCKSIFTHITMFSSVPLRRESAIYILEKRNLVLKLNWVPVHALSLASEYWNIVLSFRHPSKEYVVKGKVQHRTTKIVHIS